LLEHGDSMKAAEALASKVTDDGGTDNCSIIIVNLNQT
jgi:serine/threonine protein phosphatase PrpC